MKKITLEEHFSVPELSYRLKRRFASAYAQELDARLLDVEQWRLPEMDQHGVADRILFSIDYPYQRIEDGAQFIETAPISDGDKAKICYKNAEQLLNL
jgi:predicted TIM-barrel fold metal-dependent hydrolase